MAKEGGAIVAKMRVQAAATAIVIAEEKLDCEGSEIGTLSKLNIVSAPVYIQAC